MNEEELNQELTKLKKYATDALDILYGFVMNTELSIQDRTEAAQALLNAIFGVPTCGEES